MLTFLSLIFGSSLALSQEAKAPTGWGVVVGWPSAFRYQKGLDWKNAMFFDVGYQMDGYAMVDANYSQYLMRAEDKWREDARVGTVLYNIFGGLTAGYRVNDDREEKSLFGIRGGAALEYLFPKSPWAIRAEVAPVLFFSGTTAAGMQGGLVLMHSLGGKPRRLQNSKSPAKTANPHSASP